MGAEFKKKKKSDDFAEMCPVNTFPAYGRRDIFVFYFSTPAVLLPPQFFLGGGATFTRWRPTPMDDTFRTHFADGFIWRAAD